MLSRSQLLRKIPALAFSICVILIVAPGLAVKTSSAASPKAFFQSGETIEQFIRNAYHGVGQFPSCITVSNENSTLEGLLPTTSAAFETEARRFVSTLIETQTSYNTPSPYFEETTAYAVRNPINSGQSQAFVTDLYFAFLQRQPDAGGLAFWTNNLNSYPNPAEGRREVLDAFGTIPDDAEFTNLVHSLVDGGAICCPRHCPPGYHFDCEAGQCMPD